MLALKQQQGLAQTAAYLCSPIKRPKRSSSEDLQSFFLDVVIDSYILPSRLHRTLGTNEVGMA